MTIFSVFQISATHWCFQKRGLPSNEFESMHIRCVMPAEPRIDLVVLLKSNAQFPSYTNLKDLITVTLISYKNYIKLIRYSANKNTRLLVFCPECKVPCMMKAVYAINPKTLLITDHRQYYLLNNSQTKWLLYRHKVLTSITDTFSRW